MEKPSPPLVKSAAERLIELLGWQVIAAACVSKQTGRPISKQAVYKWVQNGIPPEQVLTCEDLARGAINRFEMRPDLHGEKPEGWVSPFVREVRCVAA